MKFGRVRLEDQLLIFAETIKSAEQWVIELTYNFNFFYAVLNYLLYLEPLIDFKQLIDVDDFQSSPLLWNSSSNTLPKLPESYYYLNRSDS